jgi:hypothetical protein
MIEPNFQKGDYIISDASGDMAIISSIDKKKYYHFKEYYGKMFEEFKDTKKYLLQVNYQKFFRKCTDDEIKKLNNMIKEKKEQP